MPIVIEAVPEEQFLAWIKKTKNKFAMLDKKTLALVNLDNK